MQSVHDVTENPSILDVSKALAAQLWSSLKDDPQAKTFIASPDQIALTSPKSAGKAAKLSVFPYLIAPDSAARNTASFSADGKRTTQTACSVRFLLTPCTGSAEGDLFLLGKTIQTLLASPILVNPASAAVNPPTMTLDSVSPAEMASLWTSLGEPLRPCTSFTVSPIMFVVSGSAAATTQPAPAAKSSPHVTELYQAVFKTFSHNVEDWKHRNMIQRQYVLMEFSKNTDMTVDDMLSQLRSLGERLETGRPIEPYVDALKKLEGFYEHQQAMLKGFEKVQKKRQEGIDLVAKWKSEVTELIKALNN